MKELSIEQKAKAYDEAIKKAEALYKASEPMSGCNVIIETLFPELKESEDERIRKGIIATIHLYYGEPLEDEAKEMIDWLEKQGQKPQGKSALEAAKEEKVDNQNCVKTDNVEPKFNFKVGQWIVATGKCVYLITKIDGFNVTLVDTNGDEYVFDVSSLDDAYQWTIEDAKDGDVLVDSLGNVCIYQEPSTKLMYHSHCYGSHKRFIDMLERNLKVD